MLIENTLPDGKENKITVDERFPLALPEGTILAGQYMIEKVLGQGGFGITYRATDHKTGQKVAVKEFFPDTLAYREAITVISYPGERSESYEYGKESFLQEAQTLAAFIGNENIVRIHSYFEENGTAYFVMDYIEGKSFDEYIKGRGGKISVEEAKRILIPMMDALNIVHSKGIVHRDVTPDNIYITNDGTVKLLDFGAARYSLGDKSRSLDVILKHGFAPKEQYTRRGKQGPFTDIYSLGATFYFAITGKRPPDSVERLDEDDLIPPSNLGVDITEYQESAILQALSVQPADRFQTMADFKRVLINERTATNQIFFTAPEANVTSVGYQEQSSVYQQVPVVQQGSVAAQQEFPSAQQNPNVMQDAEQSAQKADLVGQSVLQKLKHKKLVAGIVGALVVVFLIGLAVSGNKAKEETNTASRSSVGEKNDSQSSGVVDGSDYTMISPDSSEEAPPKTGSADAGAKDSVQSVGYSLEELIVVGNTPANIKNDGLYTVNEGREFWVDFNQKSLLQRQLGADAAYKGDQYEYVFQDRSGTFSCVSFYDGILYFLYNGEAYMKNIVQDSDTTLIPELEAYGGSIERLYVTIGCYFIYTDETLFRISRKNGQEEDRLAISSPNNFTFDNEGCLYYISENADGFSTLYKRNADDFQGSSDKSIVASNVGAYFTDPAVDGNCVYVLLHEGSATYIKRFNTDFGYEGDDFIWDISAIVNADGQGEGNYALELNVIDRFMFFTVCEAKYEKYGTGYTLYYVSTDSNSNTSDYTCVAFVSRYPCVAKKNGTVEVEFLCFDTDYAMWTSNYDFID